MRELAVRAGRIGDIQGLIKLADMAIDMAQAGNGLALLNQRGAIATVQEGGGSLSSDRYPQLSRAQSPTHEAWPEW